MIQDNFYKELSIFKEYSNISKVDMKLNTYRPVKEVVPEIYEVRADGVNLRCEPAEILPMAQQYFLF